MKGFVICAIAVVIIAAVVGDVVRSEVLTLTEDTFADKVKEKGTVWFVKFCVPWCKHCKNLGSTWDDLGKAMEEGQVEEIIEIGQVDCATTKPICNQFHIHSYPSFNIFYDGQQLADFKGPRDVESLKAFVLEEAEKASARAQLGTDQDL